MAKGAIIVKDTNKNEFHLLKNTAKDCGDYGFYAKKAHIRAALENGNAFILYRNYDRNMTEPPVRIYPEKTKLTLELGCHLFRGRARAAVLRWLKS